MPIPDTEMIHFEVKVHGLLDAQGMSARPTVNIFHYRRTAFPVPVVQLNTLTAFQTLVEASWLAAASVHWTLVDYEIRCINDPTDGGSLLSVGTAGGIAGEAEPGFNNMVIHKATAYRGRNYMGRSFVAGLPESGADGNTLTAGQLALLSTLAGKLDDGFADGDTNPFVPFLFSASQSQIETYPCTVIGADIILCTARDPVGVLKSRKARA